MISAPRVPRASHDFERQLEEQVGFLKKSARDFDAGDTAEAKRIAAALRILLHDKGASRSLLGQLGRLGGKFLSTAIPHTPGNIATHSGLVIHTERGHVAPLESALWSEWVTFADWWNEIVFVDKHEATITRRDIVLMMGEQDGGHHVDPAIDARYDAISRRNSLNWYTMPGAAPLENADRAAVRQIGHEVIRTLDPRYRGGRPSVEIVLAGVVMEEGPRATARRPPRSPQRNDPCPCGSGAKWKKCHGAPAP